MFKKGDKVFIITENWTGTIVELPGYSPIFPKDYRVKRDDRLDTDRDAYGLCSPNIIRKLTKLEKAL